MFTTVMLHASTMVKEVLNLCHTSSEIKLGTFCYVEARYVSCRVTGQRAGVRHALQTGLCMWLYFEARFDMTAYAYIFYVCIYFRCACTPDSTKIFM